jgi:hypothetical protein
MSKFELSPTNHAQFDEKEPNDRFAPEAAVPDVGFLK